MSRKFLNPPAVAKLRGCDAKTVVVACLDGTLRGMPIYGPAGRVTTWAIRESAADRWVPPGRGPRPKRKKTSRTVGPQK